MTDMRWVTWLATCRRCYWSLVCSGISLQRGSCEWLAHSKRDELSTSPSCEQDTDLQGRWRYPAGSFRFLLKSKAKGGAKPVRLCPCSSDVHLFSYGEGIIDLDTKISEFALDLRMSQQQLDGT